jgi:transcriptional regulator of acetoin/glycerol metabolism
MSRFKLRATRPITRELRRKVAPWETTRKKEIVNALKKAQGDILLAATLLGLGKTTVYRAMEDYRISLRRHAR